MRTLADVFLYAVLVFAALALMVAVVVALLAVTEWYRGRRFR